MSDWRDFLVGHERLLNGCDGQFLFRHVHLQEGTRRADNGSRLSHRRDALRRLDGYGHDRLDSHRRWRGGRQLAKDHGIAFVSLVHVDDLLDYVREFGVHRRRVTPSGHRRHLHIQRSHEIGVDAVSAVAALQTGGRQHGIGMGSLLLLLLRLDGHSGSLTCSSALLQASIGAHGARYCMLQLMLLGLLLLLLVVRLVLLRMKGNVETTRGVHGG